MPNATARSKTSQVKKSHVVAAFAVIYVVWGTTYLATKIAVDSIPPFLMRGAACTGAGLILCLWDFFGRQRLPTAAETRNALITGVLLFLLCQGVQGIAQQHVASGLTALTMASAPLLIPVVAWLARTGDIPSTTHWLGVLFGMAGVALLVFENITSSASSLSLPWAAVLLLCCLSWSVGTILSNKLTLPSSPRLKAGLQLICGGAALLVAGWVSGEGSGFELSTVPLEAYWAVLYHIVANYLLAFSCYIWLLSVCPPQKVATYTYVNPVVAVTIGTVFANEAFTYYVAISTILIITAVVFGITSKR